MPCAEKMDMTQKGASADVHSGKPTYRKWTRYWMIASLSLRSGNSLKEKTQGGETLTRTHHLARYAFEDIISE